MSLSIHEKLNVIIVFLCMLLVITGIVLGIFISAFLNEPNIQNNLQWEEDFDYTLVENKSIF